MENNKKYSVIVIALIVIIGLLINQNMKFKKEMNQMRNHISNVENNIRQELVHSNSNILNRVESLLEEQQSMVSEYKSTYKGVDTQAGTIRTLVEFTLKEVDAAANVYLDIAAHNDANSNEYECSTTNGLKFSCEIDLAYSDDYILNIYQESADGSSKILNSSPYYQNVKSEFDNRLRVSESGTSTDKEKMNYSFQLQNNTFGEPSFRIKTVGVKAFYEDKEVFMKDVTNYNIVNREEMDRLNLMIASGQIDAIEIPEVEYNEMPIDDNGVEHGNYLINILHSEAGVTVEDNKFPEYSFKLIITLNNGDVLEF